MASSDGQPGCRSQSLSGYVALVVCGVLVLGFMPLSVIRVDVVRTSEPQVKQSEPVRAVELLSGPPVEEPVMLKARAEPAVDATGQTSRLVERSRVMDQPQRHLVRPVVNPLRDPVAPPKRKGERPGAAERLFDEFP